MSFYTIDSLLDMSKRATARYANIITDFGDLSYELMRPALLKIEKPEHLVKKPPPIPRSMQANTFAVQC
jgi:hypothetical protein